MTRSPSKRASATSVASIQTRSQGITNMGIAAITSKSIARFSRRGFLAQIGVGAAVLPLIHAERALAATASGFPKRLITIAWTNGVARTAFYPAADDPTDSPILKQFAPLKSKVLLPAGLDMKIMLDAGKRYDGHFSYPTMFTGTYKNIGGQNATATGPSIDQAVADNFAKTANLSMPVFNAAVGGSSTSFRADAARNTGETNPSKMYGRLFAGKNLPVEQVDALRNRRRSVLDFLGKDLDAYGKRLGTEDRTKIAAHTQSIRELETQLAANTGNKTCMAPVAPAAGGSYDAKVKLFSNMAALAIRCDLTRSVSLVWGADGGSGPLSFPHIGIAGDYHGIAHKGPAGYSEKIQIDTWLFGQVFALASALNDTMEAGGSALDNSVIVTGNDMSEGSQHNVGGVPFLMVGSAGGFFKTGRVVRLGSWAGKPATSYFNGDSGIPHNRLLATLANAMDIPGESFGASGYGGTLPELRK